MPTKKLWESFNFAIEGVIYALKTQRNLRLHAIIGMAALILSLLLPLERVEIIIIVMTIVLVFITEMLNTALELIINLLTETYHPLARIAKDISAGAVFLATVNAIFVGYLILYKKYLLQDMGWVISKLQSSYEYIAFICLVIVIILVILGKASLGRGSPLRGGMPSGHTAVAFSIATVVALYISNLFFSILLFILAYMIGESRVRKGPHTWKEVIAGALLGIGVTMIIFKLFYAQIIR